MPNMAFDRDFLQTGFHKIAIKTVKEKVAT
jgi:hypothetical protein